ncbi:MAG: PEP-CTERM sorting domain-containing protein [Gammaproteobacteria bacterium]
MPVKISRKILSALLAPALLAIALPGYAITVTYDWVPNSGQGGTGYMTFADAGIVDPANFSGIPLSALTDLQYQWDNGATINLASVQTLTTNPASWQASGGFLITGFQLTANSVPPTTGTFSLQMSQGLPGNPGPGYNATNSVLYGAEGNAGQWQLHVVPVPAAVWLFGSAAAGLMFLRRRT